MVLSGTGEKKKKKEGDFTFKGIEFNKEGGIRRVPDRKAEKTLALAQAKAPVGSTAKTTPTPRRGGAPIASAEELRFLQQKKAEALASGLLKQGETLTPDTVRLQEDINKQLTAEEAAAQAALAESLASRPAAEPNVAQRILNAPSPIGAAGIPNVDLLSPQTQTVGQTLVGAAGAAGLAGGGALISSGLASVSATLGLSSAYIGTNLIKGITSIPKNQIAAVNGQVAELQSQMSNINNLLANDPTYDYSQALRDFNTIEAKLAEAERILKTMGKFDKKYLTTGGIKDMENLRTATQELTIARNDARSKATQKLASQARLLQP